MRTELSAVGTVVPGKKQSTAASRPLLVRLVVAVAAVILGFLLGEGVVRFAFPEWAPRTARLTDFWRYDRRYGWSHIPGTKGIFRSHGIDAEVVINAKGFRGPEVPYARTPERPRVLFLGDSLTWGFGIAFDDIFVTRLERSLPPLETVNLAVSGYATDQELLLYQDEGRKYRPDLVVIVVAYNDSLENAQTVAYAVYGKPAFVLRDGQLQLINQPVAQPSIMTRAFTRLAWRSYILTGIHRALHEASSGPRAAGDPGVDHATVETVPPRFGNWALTVRLLLELARATCADGTELLVVFSDGIAAAPALARLLAVHGVDSIVLDEVLDQGDPTLHLPDKLHWSPLGHVRVASALTEPIRRKLAGESR